MTWNSHGQWNDGWFDHDKVKGFIVEFGQTNPVPEPTTLLLVGFGLLGLAGLRRRLLKR